MINHLKNEVTKNNTKVTDTASPFKTSTDSITYNPEYLTKFRFPK